jgi:putative copper export protein/mono/diheme cytochrome c family protein
VFNGAFPPFALDQGGWPLALARGVAVAFLLWSFGALLFRALVAPPALRRLAEAERHALDHVLVRWARLGVLGGILFLLLWLPVQAGAIVGAGNLAAVARAVPDVAMHTRFGHLALLQIASLVVAALLLARPRWSAWAAVAPSCLALVLQAGHGHGAAMEAGPSVPLASDVVHLLGAGAWLGGLWPLLLMVRHAPAAAAASACRYFSPLGKWCLVAVLASAGVQFWELIGGIPGLVGTAYGWVAIVKFALFGVLFIFALANRYTLAPRLLGAEPAAARRGLIRSIAVQSGVGILVVLAAGLLSQLSPAMHIQPVWPFAVQPSLVTVQEDAEFRDEVLRALAALAGAVAILALAIAYRRQRWFGLLAVVVAALLSCRAVPHLDLLFVPATPTSFYRSPTGFSAESIMAGAALYPANCTSCHGAEGRGDGPAAAGLAVPPADLTAPHLWDHADGEMYGWLASGMAAPRGGLSMPGFSGVLDADAIWALIDFIRARNGGLAHAASGAWSPPVQAPGFQMRCGGADEADLAALRGSVVRVVFARLAAPSPAGVATVLADAAATPGQTCTADDAAIRAAYAVVTGVPAARLVGAEVLIDGNGWLREVRLAQAGSDAAAESAWLAAALQRIAAQPIDAAAGASGHHHHE